MRSVDGGRADVYVLDRVRIRERALARFSADAMVDRYVNVYEGLVGSQVLHNERL